ncbi:MAG: hypothetical protein WA130_11100 [Candidatus Methanoperedens sp.]
MSVTKKAHKSPISQERNLRVVGSAGKKIGNFGIWGKLGISYYEKRKRG